MPSSPIVAQVSSLMQQAQLLILKNILLAQTRRMYSLIIAASLSTRRIAPRLQINVIVPTRCRVASQKVQFYNIHQLKSEILSIKLPPPSKENTYVSRTHSP